MELWNNNLERLKKENKLRAEFLTDEHKNKVFHMERYLHSSVLSIFEIQLAVKGVISSCLKNEHENIIDEALFTEEYCRKLAIAGRRRTASELFVVFLYRCAISLLITFLVSLFAQGFSSRYFNITLTTVILMLAFVIVSYIFRDWAGGISVYRVTPRFNAGMAMTMALCIFTYLKIKKYGNEICLFSIDIS